MTASAAQNHPLGDFAGTLVLVGAGKMGGAMLDGWLGLGLDPRQVAVFEPQPSELLTRLAERGLRLNAPREAIRDAAAMVIAVKPQAAACIIPEFAPLVSASTLIVSIMAGTTLTVLERLLPSHAAVVRAMPNTPASIGRGITAAVANSRVQPAQRALAQTLLSATGKFEWVADERLMDAVTAVSGSGPAYVFLLAETLTRAGIAAGLPAELAAQLARTTVSGSGELLERSPLDPSTLRENVTSPGGTTAAALKVLMADDGLEALMRRAVAAATERSRELGG